MRKMLLAIVSAALLGCSVEHPEKTDSLDLDQVDTLFLSADITGSEPSDPDSCPAQITVEINADGNGWVSWNNEGEFEQHGCFHDSAKDLQKTDFLLNSTELAQIKENFGLINWNGKYESIENASLAPHRDCKIEHDSLPDIYLSMTRNKKYASYTIYTYELNGDRVSENCKMAILRETDIVQRIIDLLPVPEPIPSKLYYRTERPNGD